MSVPRFDAIHARIVGVEIGLSAGVDMEGGSWMASNLKGISTTCKRAWCSTLRVDGGLYRETGLGIGRHSPLTAQ